MKPIIIIHIILSHHMANQLKAIQAHIPFHYRNHSRISTVLIINFIFQLGK